MFEQVFDLIGGIVCWFSRVRGICETHEESHALQMSSRPVENVYKLALLIFEYF